MSQRVEESGEEDDCGNGQVDVPKRVLELSSGFSVRVPHLDKDTNGYKERRGAHRKENQATGKELT